MIALKKTWPLLLVLLVTAAVYSLSLKNGFVNLDDPLLVSENKHVLEASVANVWHVFTHFDPELYIPVTFLSYQLEAWTLGPSAWHFHLVNVLLHLGNVVLAFLVTKKLSGNKHIALLASALFALHPINAEAVLWISARKDLLSSFFFLTSLYTFLLFEEKPGKKFPVLSVVLFMLALGSKVTTVTLPLVLLLVSKEPDPRTRVRRTLPYFLLALLFGVIAMTGKTVVAGGWNPVTMVLMAFRSVLFYLQLIVIPAGNAAVHSVPPSEAYSPLVIAGIAAVVFGFWITKRYSLRFPVLWTGWCFFLLTLAPSFLHYTRGHVNIMLGSERYAYLPSLGIFLLVSAVVVSIATSERIGKNIRKIFVAAIVMVLLALAYLTTLRTFVYEDSIIFNIDILQKYPNDARSRYNLGVALQEAKRPSEAEEQYRASIEAEPTFARAAIALGVLLMKEGRKDEAINMLTYATRVRPDYFQTHFHLGVAYQQLERWDEAIDAYKKTIELFPDFPEVRKNLATVYGQKKMFREALAEYEILAQIDPGFRQQYEQIKESSE